MSDALAESKTIDEPKEKNSAKLPEKSDKNGDNPAEKPETKKENKDENKKDEEKKDTKINRKRRKPVQYGQPANSPRKTRSSDFYTSMVAEAIKQSEIEAKLDKKKKEKNSSNGVFFYSKLNLR